MPETEDRGARTRGERLRLDLVGGFAIRTDRRSIALSNRKGCCLLAYLALSTSGLETRERLAGLLWSESGEEKARMSLRQCLRHLQDGLPSLGFTGLHANRETISLDRASVDVDIVEILAGLEAGRIDERLMQDDVAGRLLYGMEDVDPAFQAWLMVRRHSILEQLTSALESLLDRPDQAESVRRAAAEALIRLDPSHEKAYRVAIRDLAARGNVAGALRLYKKLWDLLGSEYDMEPSEQTQQLIAEIKLGEVAEPAPPPRIAAPAIVIGSAPRPAERPRIGVTAFADHGVPAEQRYVVAGFQRELVAALVRFREWTILDGLIPDPAAAVPSRALPFDYVLDGSCYPADGALQLTIILKDMATRRFIWSERYAVGLEDWFKAQQRIVRRIAVALNVHLSADRVARRMTEPGVAFETYDRWLRGQSLIAEWRPETETDAETIFRDIVSQTPDFAPAYASLASLYNSRHIVFPGVFRSPELEAQALTFASRAVELDPLDTRSQLALAWSNVMRGRFEQAELHYGLSFDLNSSDPATLISCAQGLAFCGRLQEARGLADAALLTHPVLPAYHWGYLVGINFLCGDYERSIAAADLARDAIFNLPGWKAAALAHLDRPGEARDEGRRLLDLARRNWVGSGKSDEETVVRWFLHSFPLREPGPRHRLREGLRMAGLPAPDL